MTTWRFHARVAMLTSVSQVCRPWAEITNSNHANYCLRHNYTYIARSLPYELALSDFKFIRSLFDYFDIVWCLDADAVVTNFNIKVESLPLGCGLNVCEEGLLPYVYINCGSTIWIKGEESNELLTLLAESEHEWRQAQFWQGWIANKLKAGLLIDMVKVHPSKTFNSCHSGKTCLWQAGDFVYHPCGMKLQERVENIRKIMKCITY